jgi:hypothetical protein
MRHTEFQPHSGRHEGIHQSVLTRSAGNARLCSDDDKGVCSLAAYKPDNLMPFFNGGAFNGLPIVD